MYSYVLYYNIEKSGFNAVSAYLLYYLILYSVSYDIIGLNWNIFFSFGTFKLISFKLSKQDLHFPSKLV